MGISINIPRNWWADKMMKTTSDRLSISKWISNTKILIPSQYMYIDFVLHFPRGMNLDSFMHTVQYKFYLGVKINRKYTRTRGKYTTKVLYQRLQIGINRTLQDLY